jgi:energy-coupling factor transport system permease protein
VKDLEDTFSTYHPIVNFTFFCAVIGFGMVFIHPVLLSLSLAGAFTYSLTLNGRRTIRFTLLFVIPMMIIAGLVNPLFNHRGMTILRFIGDNPLTLESIFYGVSIAVMFAAIILWFSCVNIVMTTDKIMYLLGRLLPSLSMIFAMVLRFMPTFKRQINLISSSQKSIGQDISKGTIMEKIKHGIKILSIMITWALENAIETADSMRARGYGLEGRTCFSLYRLEGRDVIAIIFYGTLVAIVVTGGGLGENNIQYFPYIKIKEAAAFSYLVYLSYAFLCFSPTFINIREAIIWKHLRSKI